MSEHEGSEEGGEGMSGLFARVEQGTKAFGPDGSIDSYVVNADEWRSIRAALADRLATVQADLEFSRQTTTNVMDALTESGAETAAAEAERDEWMARRDAAVAQCRHLHQDGKTREQWHLDNCGAMRALRDAEAARDTALREKADLEARLAAVEAVLPDQCWVSRDTAIRCTDFIGGDFENGAKWTEGMCCLPCRIRAALANPSAAQREAEVHDDETQEED